MIPFKQFFKQYILNENVLNEVPRNLLGMKTSITQLPDNKPYGFWVDRSGNFLPVNYMGHTAAIKHIIYQAMMFLLSNMDDDYQTNIQYLQNLSHTYSTMWEMGWIRVYLVNKDVIWEMKGNRPSTSQIKFLNILKNMYDLDYVVEDV